MDPAGDWRELAVKAGQEQDPKKLQHLIQLLCEALLKAQEDGTPDEPDSKRKSA